MAFKGIINPNQIRHEIETLKSQKQEIEARISLLESQLHQQQHSSCTNDSCPPISAVQGRQEEDKKPGDQAAYINLKVKGQVRCVETEVVFRMKRSTELKKLMNAYCDHRSVGFKSIAFCYKGRYLRSNLTPDQLQMEDGDEIDTWLHLPLRD